MLLNLRAEQVQFFYNSLQEGGELIRTIDKIHTAFHATLEESLRCPGFRYPNVQ